MTLHPFHQRTFKQRASIDGIGLHSGEKVRLTLAPALADSGIVFVRTDLSPMIEIPAVSANVVDTTLNTSLGRNGVRIGTVEHVLAALAGCGIDNARIEVEGPEVPVLDGSADPFVRLVRGAGVHEQRALRKFAMIRKTVEVQDGGKLARLSPSRGSFSIRYTIDFQHPLVSDQSYELEINDRSFGREIARARTFGSKRDVERLHQLGLARGGSLANAVVIDDYNILNPDGLRYPDEFVRHKILDAVGDLSLLGMPILGRFTALKSGHALNHALVQRVFSERAYEIVAPREADELREIQESAALAFEDAVA